MTLHLTPFLLQPRAAFELCFGQSLLIKKKGTAPYSPFFFPVLSYQSNFVSMLLTLLQYVIRDTSKQLFTS